MATTFDSFTFLGLPPTADAKAIEEARRRLAEGLHPDANAGKADEVQRKLEEMLKQVNAAADEALANLNGAHRLADAPAREQTIQRGVPCPYGDHVGVYSDLAGADALLTCPHCGGTFAATVGATAQHDAIPTSEFSDFAQFAVVAWAQSTERLFYFVGPPELFVRAEDDFSIVYDDENRPSWLVNHTLGDHRWRLGAPDLNTHMRGELNLGRVLAALVVWALVGALVLRGHGTVVGVAWAAYLAGMLVAPILFARRRGRGVVRWTLASLLTAGAAGFVLAFARSSDARGHDSDVFRIWIPGGLAAVFAIFGLIDIVSSAGNGAGVWLALAALLGFFAFRNRQVERR